ncbi:alpha/beta fold hydrolase [Pontibacter sp. FD36]|uniref:alpha/beta hydrolase family protein n=1 Tax=Pontibacter sp. FD36 TaxID=2789860 RepID=UPI0018AB7CCC|nr:alpha/beta fold hydrolase [Pontibacter sp. FD36]MBF8965152.1 alpha/beta fold hydrolase [Pontibacter sp. FD36]
MKKTIYLLFAFCLFACTAAWGQQLQRRPFLGVQVSPVTDSLAAANRLSGTQGAFVRRVIPNSTAAALKLQVGDVIVRVNGTPINNYMDVPAMARQFRTGEFVTLDLNRKGKQTTVKGKVQPMPFETDPNAEVRYGEVPLPDNRYARSILKKLKGKGRFPTIFFVQGYGCSSLDNLPAEDPQRQLIDGLVARGYAVFRMDKPGSGDSQGSKPCTEIGYQEELEAFTAGLKLLKQDPAVDPENVFLFGHSLGGNTAPLMAAQEKVKGLMVYGITGKPWFEYLLEVYRDQRTLLGADYVQVDQDMRTVVPLLYEFMILKKTPEELAKNPAYRTALENIMDYDGQGHLYGRHYTFLQDLQDLPMSQAWRDANAYTLAIYGEADVAALDPSGAQLVVNLVNSYHPGKATFELLPRTDHGFMEVGTMQEHVKRRGSAEESTFRPRFNQKLVELVDTWMKDKIKRA